MTSPAAKPGGRRRIAVIAAAVTVLFALLAFVGYRWATNDALATLVDFSGQAERDTKATLEQWQGAAQGDEFSAGDGARTMAGSVAHFRLEGGAKLELKPSSKIRFQRPSKRGQVKVDVDMGEASVESGGGPISIDSEFGAIVLDQNSAVTLSRAGSKMNVSVDLGSISVSDRKVEAGETLDLELGGLVLDVPVAEPTASTEPTTAATEVAPAPSAELQRGNGVATSDLVVKPGESFVVHDPNPPTAIGFRLSDVCSGPARVTAGGQQTEAVGQANLRFDRGRYSYEVRCLDAPDVVRARGTIKVLHDSGTARLPTFAPTANIATDGRTYTVLYQHRLPKVTIHWPAAPQAEKYTLKIGSRSISTTKPYYTFSSLPKGRHSIVFSAQTTPPRQSRTTNVDVVYDSQAPTARVSESALGDSDDVRVSGQTLPGWNVSVDGKELDVDSAQRFSVQVSDGQTVPITFSHPGRDTHYYLRRPKAAE
jgi:hypothetical protein